MNRHRVLLALILVSAAGIASAEEKSLNRTFTVAAGGTLTVDADSGADISVSGGDVNTVVVRIDARGTHKELDELTLSAEPSGDGVKVQARRPQQRGWFH